jgi:hypothetical protein
MSTTDTPVDDGYPVPDEGQLSSDDLVPLFNGILRHIFIRSERKYNQAEIEVIYKTRALTSDAASILDYESKDGYQCKGSSVEQYIGVKFLRMQVWPVAYAIRAVRSKSKDYLVSWVFQARQAHGPWVTLSEQMQRDNLAEPGSHFREWITADHWGQEFRVMQTYPTRAGTLSFGLSGFEIHGFIKRNREPEPVPL